LTELASLPAPASAGNAASFTASRAASCAPPARPVVFLQQIRERLVGELLDRWRALCARHPRQRVQGVVVEGDQLAAHAGTSSSLSRWWRMPNEIKATLAGLAFACAFSFAIAIAILAT
jgi:hypothetical protein